MNPKKERKGLNRRNFLIESLSLAAGSGLIASQPARILLTAAISQVLGTSKAEASVPTSDVVFVNFFGAGGLTKWIFDCPLTPSATDIIAPGDVNPLVGTTLGSNLAPVYSIANHPNFNGIRMPALWGGQIPVWNGSSQSLGSTAISGLAANLLMMRGINEIFDSHEIQSKNQILFNSPQAITALVAESATTPIPACSFGGSLGYTSKRGISNLNIGTDWSNPLKTALGVFDNNSLWVENSTAAASSAIDALLAAMKTNSASKHQRLPNTYDERTKAKQLILTQFGDLQAEFDIRKSTYKALLEAAIRNPAYYTQGVDTVSVPGLTTPGPANINYQNPNGADSRTLLSRRLGLEKNIIYSGANFNAASVWESATVNQMAEGFAIAEFMLTKGLSSAVNVMIGKLDKLTIDNAYNYSSQSFQTLPSYGFGAGGMDMHDTGSAITLIAMTRWYRAYLACMNHFIAVLKNTSVPSGGNLFQRTVIANSSEFNRSPRLLEDGSDHGYNGHSHSIFSGMIPSCQVIGNVKPGPIAPYSGIWGYAGQIQENANRELFLGNVASTLATLLNIASPTQNDASLVIKSGGMVTGYTLPRGKNVA
jgi:hypothetical protein